jgi:protein phosphatase 2C family protein 2/3
LPLFCNVWLNFDYSAGATVAEHAQSRLANHINETLSHTSSKTVETYTSAIQAALDEEDKCIDREDFTGGSTVALALIDTKQRILVDADLGDSHVVLAEHVKRNKKEMMKLNMLDPSLRLHHLGTKKNEWTVTRLSTPHDLDNPSEKRRIEAAGGEIKYDTGVPRIGEYTSPPLHEHTRMAEP